MEAKHTPAPWRIDEDGDGVPAIVGPREKASRRGIEGEWDICVMDWDDEPDRKQVIFANARLIAAAPDLLAQHNTNLVDLDLLRRAIAEGDPKAELLVRVDDLIRFSRDAIAKAVSSHV